MMKGPEKVRKSEEKEERARRSRRRRTNISRREKVGSETAIRKPNTIMIYHAVLTRRLIDIVR